MKTKIGVVSILMNCYNGEKFLREAVESVLEQTYIYWEIIFWDNQSNDDSANIFQSYSDPRFKYYLSPQHTPLYEARNLAYAKATGEFIAFLDVDDIWFSQKLEHQLMLFKDPQIGFVCSNFLISTSFNGKSRLAENKLIPQGRVLDSLLRHYFVGLVTLIVRRSALSLFSTPFESRYHIIGDFDLVMRLAVKWDVGSIQHPLALYRIHGQNDSLTKRDICADELEFWCQQYSSHPFIGNSKFFFLVRSRMFYAQSIAHLFADDIYTARAYMSFMPLCRLKIRLFLVILSYRFINYLSFLKQLSPFPGQRIY